jgi:predicted permease
LAFLLVAGFAARKLKIIGEQETESIPKIIFAFFYPALTIFTFGEVKSFQIQGQLGILAIFTGAVTIIIYIASGVALHRCKHEERKALLHFQASIGNVVYVLIPIVSVVWGTTAVTYCVVISSVQDLFIWTLYYAEFSGVKKGIKGLKKLLSPLTLALLIGLILLIFNIRITGSIAIMLSVLSSAVSPLAFLFMGSVMAEKIGMNRLKLSIDSVAMTLFRVTLLPLAVYFAATGIGLHKGIAVLVALSFATPLPVMAVVWSKMFSKDTDFAVGDLIISTVAFCIMYLVLSSLGLLSNIVF